MSFALAIARAGVTLALLGVPAAPLLAQSDSTPGPKVLVIATGGTIAGVQQEPGGIGGYRAGTLTAEQIIASVPPLSRYAQVEAEQFSNVASTMITPEQWVALARRINTALATRADLAGVVVTHGTDRLEETAFFLYLTVRSDKPVVVVGAQRPATGLSPDGPMNLLSAVRTVVSPQAVGKGVLVVMDERIVSAREVRKQYQRVGGFDGGEMGMLGIVGGNGVEFFFSPTRRRGPASEFDLAGVTTLPAVDLVFSYPGGAGRSYAVNPAGIVVASTGFTCAETASYQELARAGVVLVTAFPSGDNINGGAGAAVRPRTDSLPSSLRESCAELARSGVLRGPLTPTVAAQHLTPQKARILLMLALTRSREQREIQRMFNTY
jgi:L-asparaginase type II